MLCWQQGSTLATGQCNNGALPWKTDERDDLCCGSFCNDKTQGSESYEYNKCCTCNSYTTWAGTESKLEVEYVSVTGHAFAVGEYVFNDSDVYIIEHTNRHLIDIPSNLCNWDQGSNWLDIYDTLLVNMTRYWPNIVSINLRKNKIRHLPDINCLQNLDTIDLSFNALTSLRNDSINLLTKLRNLDLSYNSIKNIDPYVLSQPTLSILNANLNNNKVEQLDVTNCYSMKPFCEINYNSNTINIFVNQDNFTLDPNTEYGPGILRLQNNNIQQWPNLVSLLNLESMAQFGQLIKFGFDLRGIDLKCDCYLAEFNELWNSTRKSLWLDYFQIFCTSPQHLKGHLAYLVEPNKLVCNLTISEGCPKGCLCVDQPTKNTVFVDCSNLGLDKMPSELPSSNFSDDIILNMSNNRITNIKNATYLGSLTALDITNNSLNNIDNEIARHLDNTILRISNNKYLSKIPSVFQYRNTCDIRMDQLVLDCDCDMIWIEDWLINKQCDEAQLFKCLVPNHGLINATEFRSSMLDCNPKSTMSNAFIALIVSIVTFLVIFGAIMYIFWYEILIICLRIRQKPIAMRHKEFEYDAAITFNEEDDGLRKWVTTVLTEELSRDGYKVFLPFKDTPYGTERDKEIVGVFTKTKTFILVLSDSYFQEVENSDRSWTENEWKYAWNQFKSNSKKNIVIINYDYISSFDVPHRPISAFLRVGNVIQFGNHDNNIVSVVKHYIGPPSINFNEGLQNKKPYFRDQLSMNYNKITQNMVFPEEKLSFKKAECLPTNDSMINDLFLASSVKEEKRDVNLPTIPYSVSPRHIANKPPKFVRTCCAHKYGDLKFQGHSKLAKSKNHEHE